MLSFSKKKEMKTKEEPIWTINWSLSRDNRSSSSFSFLFFGRGKPLMPALMRTIPRSGINGQAVSVCNERMRLKRRSKDRFAHKRSAHSLFFSFKSISEPSFGLFLTFSTENEDQRKVMAQRNWVWKRRVLAHMSITWKKRRKQKKTNEFLKEIFKHLFFVFFFFSCDRWARTSFLHVRTNSLFFSFGLSLSQWAKS